MSGLDRFQTKQATIDIKLEFNTYSLMRWFIQNMTKLVSLKCSYVLLGYDNFVRIKNKYKKSPVNRGILLVENYFN